MANMTGSMQAARPSGNRLGRRARRTVIVVDDILTTGATMAEAMRALVDGSGLSVSFGLVLASGAPRVISERPGDLHRLGVSDLTADG